MATKENLMEAFAGESQANRKYTAFAEKAGEDGFHNVAKILRPLLKLKQSTRITPESTSALLVKPRII